jgi:hypothetical protein
LGIADLEATQNAAFRTIDAVHDEIAPRALVRDPKAEAGKVSVPKFEPACLGRLCFDYGVGSFFRMGGCSCG